MTAACGSGVYWPPRRAILPVFGSGKCVLITTRSVSRVHKILHISKNDRTEPAEVRKEVEGFPQKVGIEDEL